MAANAAAPDRYGFSMREPKPLDQRVREELEASQRRDEAYRHARQVAGWVHAIAGGVLGLAIGAMPRLDGGIAAGWILAVAALSAAVFLGVFLRRLETLAAMVAYPAVMLPAVVLLRHHGGFHCSDGTAFAMVLLVLVGMSLSHVAGWIVANDDP